MAAVHVPPALHAQEELPLGGVSDLSNRGPLDRLLVSELANDELTLSVRVALNEALYLRREIAAAPAPEPPGDPAGRGVRMWGVPPRVRDGRRAGDGGDGGQGGPGADVSRDAFRGRVGRPDTRAGVVAWLETLEATPQPGGAR